MSEAKISAAELNELKNEVKMAEKINEEYLKPQIQEAIERYTGVYVPSIGQDWDIVLNEIYPIIQYNLPATFFRNPRVFMKPRSKNFITKRRDPITGAMVPVTLDSAKSARTQEAVANFELEEIRYKKEVQKVLFDALLSKFGVLWHGYKGNFGMTDEQSMLIRDENVFVKRLCPLNFLKDPAVNMANLDEARWIGRSFDVPLQDLYDDDRLSVDKKALKGKLGFGEKVKTGQTRSIFGGDTIVPVTTPLIDLTDDEYRKSARSKFVRCYEIFQRPTPKERREGSKGRVILFTFEQKGELRCNKWPYKVEGWPSEILEFNPLPDSHFGLADIDTYKEIADQKNAIVNLSLRNAQENTKVWVGISKEGANEEDIDAVQKGNNTIIKFEGGNPRDRMFVASPGGQASSELYANMPVIERNLQDKSGVNDLKKGFLQSGEESATSVQIRNAGGSARPAYRQDIMADFLKASITKLNGLIKQFVPVDKAVRIAGTLDIEWSDEPTEEEIQAPTDVEIDVISMLPEDPEKEIKQLQTVLNLVVQGLTNPAIAQKLAQEGKTVNLAPVFESLLNRLKIKNPDIFRNIKPEESQGFVSVAEVRAAGANVAAALAGQPLPSPPAPEQDHLARMEMYNNILQIVGPDAPDSIAVQVLTQLIQIHQAILDEINKKESPESGQPIDLQKPSFVTAGSAA